MPASSAAPTSTIKEPSRLYEGVWDIGQSYPVWMSHGDRVTELPAGLQGRRDLAQRAVRHRGERGASASIRRCSTPRWCTRPTAESCSPTSSTTSSGSKSDWTMSAYRQRMIEKIRAQVGKGRVICGLSGGVDSSVAAVLIHEAIGDQLTCILVDHGLMRLNEADEVVTMFRDHYNIPLVHVDATRRIPRRARGRGRPRDQAQDHRPAVHRDLRGRGQEDRRRGVPRAGHALSRRHREREFLRRTVGRHQVAPQCRRPARRA